MERCEEQKGNLPDNHKVREKEALQGYRQSQNKPKRRNKKGRSLIKSITARNIENEPEELIKQSENGSKR